MHKYRNVLTQTDFGPMIININDDTISLFYTTRPMCLLDVRLIKIDVEGMEDKVVEGASPHCWM